MLATAPTTMRTVLPSGVSENWVLSLNGTLVGSRPYQHEGR